MQSKETKKYLIKERCAISFGQIQKMSVSRLKFWFIKYFKIIFLYKTTAIKPSQLKVSWQNGNYSTRFIEKRGNDDINPIKKVLDDKFMALYKGVVIKTYSRVSSEGRLSIRTKRPKVGLGGPFFLKFVYKDNWNFARKKFRPKIFD